MLPAGILAAALFALLAFAPFASAASDPVASGKTTINLNKALLKKLAKSDVKAFKVSPAKLNLKKRTLQLPVSGGSIDPTTGAGTLTQTGGIKFKEGKKSVTLKNLEINTTKKSVTAKVGKKKMKVATFASFTFAREGFGVNVKITKLKLTGNAASAMNKALAPKESKKKSKRASSSKAATGPFKANQVLGGSGSASQPSTVTVLPGGLMTLVTNTETFKKLSNVGVKIPVSAPTTEPSLGTFAFPITGGTVGPTGTAGVVQSAGGLQLLQKLPLDETGTKYLETEINLKNIYVDLAAKTLTVEVVAKSNAESPSGSGKFPLNLGNLGRSSIADITVGGVVADPATRQVTISNAAAVLQPISAEVLQGFVSVYKAYIEGATYAGTCAKLPKKCTEPAEQAFAKEKAKAAGEEAAKNEIKAGNPLGTVSFTAQGQ